MNKHVWILWWCLSVSVWAAPAVNFTQSFNPAVVKIQVTPAANHHLFRTTETITITTADNGSIRLFGFDGQVLYDGAPTSFNLPSGHYYVETNGDRTQFLVLPADYAGGDLLGADAINDTSSMEKVNRMAPLWTRTFQDGFWTTVQPQSNVWNWTALDQIVAANAGRRILIQAFGRPAWQVDDAQFIPLYKEYVRQVALRYGAQIYGIEIWNEPYDSGTHFSKLAAPWSVTYSNMVAEAAPAIRAAAPGVKVFGLGFVNFTDYAGWFQQFVNMGTVAWLDGVEYHDYDTDRFRADQDTLFNGVTIKRVDRKVATVRSIIGPDKSILINEAAFNGQSALGVTNATGYAGVTSSPPIDWRRGMARAVKYAVMYRGGGAELVLPHVLQLSTTGALPDSNLEIYGFEYGGRGPHPKTSGYLMAGYWINNATLVDGIVLNDQVFLYAWRRPNNTSLVFAWNIEDLAVPLNPNHGLAVTDLFGKPVSIATLTELPVIFHANDPDTAGLLADVLAAITNPNGGGQPNPVAQWLFNEGSGPTANDSVGTNHGALQNFNFTATSGWVAGHEGTALRFDGANDYVQLDSAKLNLTNNFTVSAWLQPLNAAADGVFLSVRASYFSSGFRFWVSSNRLLLQGQSTAGWQSSSFASGLVTNGAWHHVGIVYDQGQLKVYLNGALQETANWGGSLVMNASASTRIGAENLYSFNGLIDQLGVYDRPLTGSEILALASGSNPPPPTNQPPVLALIGNKTVNENQTLTFTISATDPDGNPLTYSTGALPTGAAFNATTRTFTWTPTYTQAGSYPATFTVSDGSLTDSETITITVNNVNRPPVLDPIGSKTVTAGQLLSFTVSGSDPDGDALTYSAVPLPAGATFNSATRTFSWTPTAGQVGNTTVTFSVSDGNLSASESVTITVTAGNQPPVLALIGNKTVNENQTLIFTISATDPDGNPLTYSTGALPAGATFNAATRTFSWTPSYTQAGSYPVTFSVSDGSLTDAETITITVNNVNRPPVLNLIGNKTVVARSTLTFTISATDPDGTAVTYAATPLPTGASFSTTTGAFSWRPKTSQVGNYQVTFSASDGQLADSETITITVTR